MTGPRRDASGDRIAELYDRFAGTLFRHAAMLLGDRAAAADAVHHVFLKLSKSGGVCQDGSIPGESYLRRALRNECLSLIRARRRDILISVDASLLEVVPGEEDRPSERLAIEQALRDLPAEQREVVHLKVWEGLTFREIAAVTGEPANTAASRYRYAIEKLRNILIEKA